MTDAQQWVWDRVIPEPNSGCWLWLRKLDRCGYGTRYAWKSAIGAHRWSYMVFRGPIPDGLEIDHLCRVRCCVNPDHLEAVTQGENKFRSRRDRCVNGHPFSGDNLHIGPDGERFCRACWRARTAAYKKRKRTP